MSDLFLEIYKQCHEHLREADKKRDQTVAFYAAVVGLFIGGLDKLGSLKVPVALVVGLIGVVAVLTLLNYRRWHTIHQNSAVVLHFLISKNLPLSQEQVERAWRNLVDSRGLRVLNPFGSADASVFYALTVLSFLPWYVVIDADLALFRFKSHILAFGLDVLGYLLALCVIAYFMINGAERAPDMNLWAFRPYRQRN